MFYLGKTIIFYHMNRLGYLLLLLYFLLPDFGRDILFTGQMAPLLYSYFCILHTLTAT